MSSQFHPTFESSVKIKIGDLNFWALMWRHA